MHIKGCEVQYLKVPKIEMYKYGENLMQRWVFKATFRGYCQQLILFGHVGSLFVGSDDAGKGNI